jgi:hypothetical protein
MTSSTTALTNDEYRSVKAWSNSDISMVLQSPALLEWSKNTPSDGSEAIERGTHLHCAVLEPDVFAKQYVKIPDFDARSKAGREAKEAFKSNMGHADIVLDHATYQQVIAMRDSILAHPVANRLLTSPGQSEVSIFAELQGLNVKARPDRIVDPASFGGKHILIDVKKTADIDKFIYSVRDFGYHRQHAFYSDVYFQLTGHRPRFVFVVVGEKRSIGRHPVRVWELPEDVVDKGRVEYLDGLEKCREYAEFGCGFDVEQLDMRGLIR